MRDDLFDVTYFKSHAATFKIPSRISLAEMAEMIEAEVADKKELLPWIKLARFGDKKTDKGSLRHDANVLAITGAEADYDGGAMSVTEAVRRLRAANIACIVHTSPSHSEDKPRWRVLAPTSQEMAKEDRYRLVARINGVLGGVVSAESFTLSQSYYYGHIDGHAAQVTLVEGRYIDQCGELDAGAVGKPGTGNGHGDHPDQTSPDIEELARRILTGESLHPSVGSIAGKYARRGDSKKSCLDFIGLAFTAAHQARYGQRWDEDVVKYVDWTYEKEAKKQAPPPPSALSTMAALEGKEFMPLKWIVPKYLPEGVTLLAGKPKIGKSWLMLGTALAVTRGDLVLCERCEQRTVLYCALEDNERRMQARIDKIIGRAERWPVNGYLVYDLPTIGNGGIERLEQYTKDYPLDLIIVDTLARFRGSKRKDEDNYAADYRTMAELHNLGRRTGVSIIVVHHVRKATADDLFDTISGTMGLSGAADTLAILTRTDDQNGLRFATRGRDVEPEDKVVAFDSDLGEWTVVEDYEPEEKGTGNTASQIAAVLQAHGFGMTPKQVAEKLGAKENAIQQALRRMAKKGQARKNQYGVYEAV